MSDSGKSDRWNSLLESLGVPAAQPTPPAEKPVEPVADEGVAAQRPKTISALPPSKAKPAPKPKPSPPKAKSPSYWTRIAGALGLEVPEEPEPEPAPTIEPPRVAPARAEAPSEESYRQAPPVAPPVTPPRDSERAPRGAREPEPGPLDDLFGEPASDIDVFRLKGDEPELPPVEESRPPRQHERERPRGRDFEPRRGREPRRRRDEEQPQRGPVLEYGIEGDDLLLGAEETAVERSEPYGERPEPAEDRPRRRRRRGRGRGRRGREEGREAGREEERQDSRREPRPRRDEPAPAAEDAYYDLDRDEEVDSDLEPLSEVAREEEDDLFPPAEPAPRRGEESARGERPRRGRRRRRGRDREEGPDERTGAFRPEYEEEKTSHRPAGRLPRHERPAEREQLEDDVETDEMDEEAVGHPAHKKIPTWQEAIGILVEANMASRSSGPERERERGRGRGRGRR